MKVTFLSLKRQTAATDHMHDISKTPSEKHRRASRRNVVGTCCRTHALVTGVHFNGGGMRIELAAKVPFKQAVNLETKKKKKFAVEERQADENIPARVLFLREHLV